MKILDRYILTKFLSAFFFVVLVLVAIVTVIDITEKNDEFIEKNVASAEVLTYVLTLMPYTANLLTPITVFIATVFVTSRLAAHTELIAMLASGISFMRLMVPYIIGATIIAVMSFGLNSFVIPEANKTRIAFEIKYIKKPYNFTDRNIHLKVAPTSYAYMRSYSNAVNTGQMFTLETIENHRLVDKISANRISWDTTAMKWRLHAWERQQFAGDSVHVERGAVMDTVLSITPEDFGSTHGLHETLTLPELNSYIAELKERGADNVIFFQIEKYIRYMAPFTALILTIIGVIMSARKSRGGSSFQIALGFLIAFIFIIAFIFSRAVAEAQTLNPILAVWIPNIIFAGLAVFLYKTVPR